MNETSDWSAQLMLFMEYWKKIVELNSTMRKTLEASIASSGDDYAEKCNDAMHRTKNVEQTKLQLSKLLVEPEDTVLDIGAGVGRLAIPLSKKVKQLTAVELSVSMMSYLRKNLQKENILNVTLVNKRWEDVKLGVDIQAHDVSVAAYSLTMPNLKEALTNIDNATKKRVYIITSADRAFDEGLWREMYGETHPIWWLDHLYLCSVLLELGIYANMEIIEHTVELVYGSLDEAVEEWIDLYLVPEGKQSILREYLSRRLQKKNGKLAVSRNARTVLLWWKKEAKNLRQV